MHSRSHITRATPRQLQTCPTFEPRTTHVCLLYVFQPQISHPDTSHTSKAPFFCWTKLTSILQLGDPVTCATFKHPTLHTLQVPLFRTSDSSSAFRIRDSKGGTPSAQNRVSKVQLRKRHRAWTGLAKSCHMRFVCEPRQQFLYHHDTSSQNKFQAVADQAVAEHLCQCMFGAYRQTMHKRIVYTPAYHCAKIL
jgi:hypothetical protein